MQRALPLVAHLFLSRTGGPGSMSMPVADRPHPDTSGTAPLLPSRMQVGIASWDASTLQQRPTARGHLDAPAHATAAPRTIPGRSHAGGTPRFSHRWDKDQGVGWTAQRGYGRSGKEPSPQERRACP